MRLRSYHCSIPHVLVHQARFELATLRFVDGRSDPLSYWCMFVGVVGLEPTKPEGERFTVSCNCRYATPQCDLQEQKGSNPRLSVLETDVLPSELYSYICGHSWTRTTFSGFFAEQSAKAMIQSCAYTMSAKCPFGGSRKTRTFEARVGLGSLAESWFLSPKALRDNDRSPMLPFLATQATSSITLTMQNYKGRMQPICVLKKIF